MPQSGRGAAFFDLDKTIIAKSSTLAFGRPLYKAGFLNRRSLLKVGIAQLVYMMFGADHDQLEKARQEMTSLTTGWDQRDIEELVTETMDEIVAPLVFEEALAIIDEHKRAGRTVVIISSSPYEVVKPLGAYLNVDEVIGTRSKVGPDGKYTGELEFYAYAEGKAEAIRAMAERDGISLADSYAYSDSVTDQPMLEVVGHPVVVNPDRELKELADERDWQVMYFARPVSLRSRIADLPRPDPKVSGAALVGVAAAAILLWMRHTRKHVS